jgi:hypothetical protein
MSSAEMYKGWLIEARPVYCVQVWSAAGECTIPVHNAKTEEEALKLVRQWIDLQMDPESGQSKENNDDLGNDFDGFDDIPF